MAAPVRLGQPSARAAQLDHGNGFLLDSDDELRNRLAVVNEPAD